MAIITASDEVAKLRRSGQIAAQALQAVVAAVRPGITTATLNKIAETKIVELGGQPSFKDYEGYGFGLCTSVNDEVVHGIPSTRKLVEGDIIGLDIGVNYQGLFTDHAVTVPVSKIRPGDTKALLLEASEEALRLALEEVRPGKHIGDVGSAIQNFLEQRGFGIVTRLTGHGLGYAVHEPPSIPNVGQAGTGPKIELGMVLAIEPMVTLGRPEVLTQPDGWTVVTADHSAAAHFEHTVWVTDGGCDIITQP